MSLSWIEEEKNKRKTSANNREIWAPAQVDRRLLKHARVNPSPVNRNPLPPANVLSARRLFRLFPHPHPNVFPR